MTKRLPRIITPKRKSRHKTKPKRWWLFPFKALRNLIFIFILGSILLTLSFRWINPPYTTFMLEKSFSSKKMAQRLDWIEIRNVSPHILIAVVAAEDQKFPSHHGFDIAAIQTALEKNQSNKTKRGASTISQQVAKNVFLYSSKNLVRKGFEAYFTLLIETLWPKWRILEVYINVAEFAPHSFGVQNAASYHFAKSAKDINAQEAALLAAVLPNPHKLHASQPSTYVSQRAEFISSQVRLLGGSNYLHNIWPETKY